MDNNKHSITLIIISVTAILFSVLGVCLYLRHINNQDEISVSVKKTETEAEPESEALIPYEHSAFSFDLLDYDGYDDSYGLNVFSLSENSIPEIPVDVVEDINNYCWELEAWGPVSYLMINIDSGRGISYNRQTKLFGASAIKGPVCTYVCKNVVDTGIIPFESVKGLIEPVILESDNDRHIELFYNTNYIAWADFASESNLYELTAGDDPFPFYSATEAAKMWTTTYYYLNSPSETALWLRDLMRNTNVSFLRNAAVDMKATVTNKAGFNYGFFVEADGYSYYDPSLDACVDCGIVSMEGTDYIVCVFTHLPWIEMDDEGSQRCTELCRRILAACPYLK